MIIQLYGNKAKIISRYATKKNLIFLIKKNLKQWLPLSNEYTIHKIDETFYHMCKSEKWSADLVSQFKDYKEYCKLGLGIIILKDHIMVSGASSYSRYQKALKSKLTPKRISAKRLGFCMWRTTDIGMLKTTVISKLMHKNEISLSLAKKLGYHYSHTYTAVEIWGY